MRIIIGYDGSDYANAALEDLPRAGLGADGVEARVMTIADVYPQPTHPCDQGPDPAELDAMSPAARRAYELTAKALAEAHQTAADGAQRLASMFPEWRIEPLGCAGTPATSLVGEAKAWDADLIVVGSQGRGALGRALLGSVSQSVLMHANCSVRVARRRQAPVPSEALAPVPLRIVLGLDGSAQSAAALNAVSLRRWVKGTEVRVVVAVDIRLATVLPAMWHEFSLPVGIDPHAQDWPVHAAEGAAKELRREGISATPLVTEGDPKRVLIEEADKWSADCIFLGARGLGRVEGILLGSVSSAVAARATCSVEVVRFG